MKMPNILGRKLLKNVLIVTSVGISSVGLMVAVFYFTAEANPHASELAFIENSSVDSIRGSVIPASCESNPPVNHGGDCSCSIDAGACTSFVAGGCYKTISWAVSWPSGTAQLWRVNSAVANGNSGSRSELIPPGGIQYSVRRADGATLPACSTTVAGPPAATLLFSPSPATINPGDSSTLSWSTTGAVTCTASGGWSGAKSVTGGSESVTPAANTTYILQCDGPGGSSGQRTATVNVNPPLVTFEATPTLIGPGNSSQLSWSTTGADTCTASGGSVGWSGSKLLTDTQSVSPNLTTTYSLSCSGPSGTTLRTATVTLPTGDINFFTPSSCYINDEESSCNIRVFWNAYNFLGSPSVRQSGAQFASTVSHPIGGFLRSVNPDTRLFQLVDTGSSFMAQRNASVDCLSTSEWAGGRCVTLPVIDMDASSELIRSGSMAQLSIEVDSGYALTCTLSDGGAPYVFAHSGTPSLVVYPRTTKVLTSAQIVTITCVSDAFPTVQTTDEVRINVLPTIQEI